MYALVACIFFSGTRFLSTQRVRMKINQLFIQHVDEGMLGHVIECFGLTGLSDRRQFSKLDMQRMHTAARVDALVPSLTSYYLPCKAKIYLRPAMTDKRCITVFKQILKLHGHCLLARERNSRHRKIILYQIISDAERRAVTHVEVRHGSIVRLSFE